jgi:catechol 2,3-dioxygenase-like lactoylglutathione lyase family enzyme
MRTRDTPRLERFYAGVLGLRVVKRDAARGSVWLDADGTVLMIEPALPEEPAIDAASRELVAFGVARVDEWRTRVSVEAETAHTLYFRDPDGRRVAVSDYPFP